MITSLAALALALLSKEGSIAMPLVAPLALAWGRRSRGSPAPALPSSIRPGPGVPEKPRARAGTVILGAVLAAAVLGGYLLVRYAALGRLVDQRAITRLDNPLVTATDSERRLTPVAVTARYASLWIWPETLCADRG